MSVLKWKYEAGALYLSIVIALIIAILTSSLIFVSFYYRQIYVHTLNQQRLVRNMDSAIQYALVQNSDELTTAKKIDLYGDRSDSASIAFAKWGLFDLALVKSYKQSDTLKKAFYIGSDSSNDDEVLYLSDENRPVLVSGNTSIKGNLAIPKSGIRAAFIDGNKYLGKELFEGKLSNSQQLIDSLDNEFVHVIQDELNADISEFLLLDVENLEVSFFAMSGRFRVEGSQKITGELKGNIKLYSDTTIIVAKEAKLEDVQLFAPSIVIEEGFNGNLQMFARDSIVVEKNTKLNYPSVAFVLGNSELNRHSNIQIHRHVEFNGILISYEQKRSPLQTLISIDEHALIKGEVYSAGVIKLDKNVRIFGKVTCNNFLMKMSNIIYENFLIDVSIDRKARSKYYLSSRIFKTPIKNKVLKWVN